MNRSYLNYFTNRNPFKFISSIFRNYKRSSDSVKRNQSEPTVAQQACENFDTNKPKSEINLCTCHQEKQIEQWKNSKFDDSASQDSLKSTPSESKLNRASSNISLRKTSCHLDLNIQEKLNHIPIQIVKIKESESSTKIPLKRAYPWQNFNLTSTRKPRYDEVKEVGDMRDEIINLQKSILRKPNLKPPVERESPAKEVKFNKMASMMIYPKSNYSVMRQARINLSTNTNNSEKVAGAASRKKKNILNTNKGSNVKMYSSNCKKHVRKLKKCSPMEQGHFWYLSNAKKQKIF